MLTGMAMWLAAVPVAPVRAAQGTAASLDVTVNPVTATAGTPVQVTVSARDDLGNVVTDYAGTVRFASSDPQADLPADYTFTAADAGQHTFTATLKTAGSQTLTVSDVGPGADSGLLSHWTFDEGAGAAVADASGNNHVGTLSGGVAWGAPAPTVSGSVYGLAFSGTVSDYVYAADPAPLKATTATVSAWFRTDLVPVGSSDRAILADEAPNAGLGGQVVWSYRLMVWGQSIPASTGHVSVDFPSDAGFFRVMSPGRVDDGNWHHVAAVRDDAAKAVQLYLDGSLVASGFYSGNVYITDNPFWIGASPYNGGSFPFDGGIDDVRIYDRALTAQEVARLAAGMPRAGAPGGSADVAVNAAAPATIAPAAGTPQAAPVTGTFPGPLRAVVRDAYGNPVGSGVEVTFAAPASGPSGTFAGGGTSATVATDASGVATAPAFTANGAAGGYPVTASVYGLAATAAFDLTNLPGPPGQAQVTAPATAPADGTPVTVSAVVFDAHGNRVADGTPVVFRVTQGSAAVAGPYQATAGGEASATVSATAPGTVAVAVYEGARRVSVTPAGGGGNGPSDRPALSADGRYVAFESNAVDLVPGDTNGQSDVFVRDTATGATQRVSVASGGGQSSGWSSHPAISADGRYVAFESNAVDLVPGDTNGQTDVFVHDRQTGATARVSVASGGEQGNGASQQPAISADGRYVAFWSSANNLVAGDTGQWDVFVHDRDADGDGVFDEPGGVATVRVSLSSDGTQGNGASTTPAISADGRYVAFVSAASNLVADDTNGQDDVFVHDTLTGSTRRVSVSSGGTQGNGMSTWPAISADGRHVAFWSFASNLVADDSNNQTDVFVHDTLTGTTRRVSVSSDGEQGNRSSYNPATSADGRYVAFASNASNLVAGDANGAADVFVRDLQTGATWLVSTATGGAPGDRSSSVGSPGALSADGRYAAFYSDATNLVPGDSEGQGDVFLACAACAPLGGATVAFRAGEAPVASDDAYSTGEGAALTVPAPGVLANDSDADGDALAAVLVTGPANGTLTLNADGSFIYVPDVDFRGADSFTYRASDGTADSNVATVTIAVTDTTAPAWAPGGVLTASSVGQTSLTLSWPAASDAGGVVGYAVYQNGSLLATVVGSEHTYEVTGLTAGTEYTFTVYAEDAAGNRSAGLSGTFTTAPPPSDNADLSGLTVSAGTLTPPFDPATTSYAVDVPHAVTSLDVTATVADPTATMSVNGTPAGSGVSRQIALNVGTNTVTIAVTAEDGRTTKTYTVTVNRAANHPPVASDDTATVLQGSGATAIDVLANDEIAPDTGETLTIIGVTQPANGTVVITGGGTGLTYSPNPGYFGTDAFTYTISDGNDGTDTATVTITVTAAPDTTPPAWAPDGALTAPNVGQTSLTLSWPPATDDAGVVSYAVYQNGSLLDTVAGSVYTYDVTGLGAGTSYTFTVYAEDAAGNRSEALTGTFTTQAAPRGGGSGGGGSGTSPTPAVAAASSVEVDPARGGSVSLADGCLAVTILPGATSVPTTFTLAPQTGDIPPTTGFVRVGDRAYQVVAETPQGQAVTEFSKPLRFEFRCFGTDLAASGANARDVFVHYYGEKFKAWIPIPTRHHAATGRITAETTHLTTFALLVNPAFRPLTDIAGHWSEEDVLFLQALGGAGGFEDHTYRPESPVTRAQFAAMLARAMGLTAGDAPAPAGQSAGDGAASFRDVQPGDWYHGEVMAAARAGIVRGFDDGAFRPDAPVTREQVAAMVARALKARGSAGAPLAAAEATRLLAVFADAGEVSGWAVEDLALAVREGILRGQAVGTGSGGAGGEGGPAIAPQAGATRAEAAAMIARFWRR